MYAKRGGLSIWSRNEKKNALFDLKECIATINKNFPAREFLFEDFYCSLNVSATFFVKANFILQITKQRSYLEKKSFFFNFIAIPKKKFILNFIFFRRFL